MMYNRLDKPLTAFSRPECSARHVRQRRTARRRARGHRSRPAHGANERRTSPEHADLEKEVPLRAPTEFYHIEPCSIANVELNWKTAAGKPTIARTTRDVSDDRSCVHSFALVSDFISRTLISNRSAT